jgi:nitrogen-specific signal transduction histidine kinase
MNRVAELLIGRDFNSVYDKPLLEMLNLTTESDEKVVFPINDILAKKTVASIKNKIILIDTSKSKKHISYCGAPILENENTIFGAIIVFRDVSKEHELELQLRHTQKMESLGQLAGGIAHDFNNLLTGIIGCATIIQKRSTDNAIAKKYAEQIINSGRRSADLTRKLLDFSRKGKISNSVFNLHKIIDETTHLIDKSLYKRIEIKQLFKASVSSVEGDPSQIQNSFLNLFINACHAMNGIGELAIYTENI